MKLFLVKRTDKIDYDESDAYVVRAENEEKAIEVCNDSYFTKETVKVTEILQDGESEIILDSFNAG